MRISKGDPQQQRQLHSQLLYLLQLTRFGVVRWKRTADRAETFSTAVKGHFVVTVWEDNRLLSLFLFLETILTLFLFYAAAATVLRLLLCKGSYTSPLTHR